MPTFFARTFFALPWRGGAESRIWWLKAAVILGCTVALAMSARLWLASRTYPLAPVIRGLPAIVAPYDALLFGALFVLLAIAFAAKRPQAYLWSFLVILAVLCVYDQTRWQPYMYMYAFLLVALSLYSWRASDAAGRTRALNISRLIVASTYFYSGLQKANMGFIRDYFPWFVQPIVHLLPFLAQPLYYFGFAVPFIQMGFAVGLLVRPTRKVAVLLAVAMHVFILAMLGPWGLNWNSVVWPWTAAMIVFDLLLFAGAEDFSWRDVLVPADSVFHGVVFVLFCVMPFFSFFNLWDSDLSAALYSGNLTEGDIHLSDVGRAALPAYLAPYVSQDGPNDNVLSIKAWTIGDMNIIEYPETRVFKTVAKSVCNELPDPTQMVLVVHEARLFRSDPQTVYPCAQL